MTAVDFEEDDRKSKTIRERREELGLTREELAERIGLGVSPNIVKRWEEVGLTEEPGTIVGDAILTQIRRALEVKGGLTTKYVPNSPKPGDLIITPVEDEDMLHIAQRSEELNLRIAVPDGYLRLKLIPPKDLTDEDSDRMQEYVERENAYAEAFMERLQKTIDLLGAETGEWEDGKSMDERLEEMDRELGEDLDREFGGCE